VSFVVPFEKETEGHTYACYRIPSLLALPNGRRLLFAEARKNCLDGPFGDHIDVVLKVSTDAGNSWSGLRVVHGEATPAGGKPVWIGNPSPILLEGAAHRGHVLLVCSRDNKNVLVLRSTDSGASFSKPIDISAQVVAKTWQYVATGPAHGLQLASGRLLVCCDHSTSADPNSRHIPGASTAIRSHSMWSDDFGAHWSVSDSLENGDECAIAVATSNGSLLMQMRQSTGNSTLKQRQFSISTSGGSSWSAPSTGSFPYVEGSNDCEASMVRLPDTDATRLIMAAPHHKAGRLNMTVFALDEHAQGGGRWRAVKQVDAGASGYSAMAAVNGSAVDLAWESAGSIRYATLQVGHGWL
jgi:sialidase-1